MRKIFYVLIFSAGFLLGSLFTQTFMKSTTLPPNNGVTKSPSPTQIIITSPSPSPTPMDENDESVLCTQDVKLCPDGSFVSRIGPNCEFSPCP